LQYVIAIKTADDDRLLGDSVRQTPYLGFAPDPPDESSSPNSGFALPVAWSPKK